MQIYKTLFLLFVILSVGCSSKVPLGGKVTYTDGEPVVSGFVVFSTPTSQSRGQIGEDGIYSMSTMGDADGIPPGTYTVYLGGTDKRIVEPLQNGEVKVIDIPQVNRKFTSPETSGLTFTVDGKQKRFDIEVERFKK